MAGINASQYAGALFNVALNNDSLLLYKEQFKEFLSLYNESTELKGILNHPDINKDDKKKIIDNSMVMDEYLKNFLKVLIDNNKVSLMDEIFNNFILKVNNTLGIEECKLISSKKLNDEDVFNIKKALEKKLNKKIEITLTVDPGLIAGIKVVFKNEIIDNSLKTRLHELKNSISGLER